MSRAITTNRQAHNKLGRAVNYMRQQKADKLALTIITGAHLAIDGETDKSPLEWAIWFRFSFLPAAEAMIAPIKTIQ